MNTIPKKELKRILIVGDACRGKSSLASKLSQKLGIQHYSTDDFYYEIKFTKVRNKQESIDKILDVFKNEKWIIEGTTEHLVKHGLIQADIILNLKYRNVLTQWTYLARRHLSRDNETIMGTLKLMKHVLYKRYGWGYRKGKLTPSQLVSPYKDKVVTLTSFKEINNFLNSI